MPCGGGARVPLENGARVELCGKDDGYLGSWYEAEVLGYDASSGQHSVRYVVDGVEQPEALSPTGFRRRWRLGKGSAAAAAAGAAS